VKSGTATTVKWVVPGHRAPAPPPPAAPARRASPRLRVVLLAALVPACLAVLALYLLRGEPEPLPGPGARPVRPPTTYDPSVYESENVRIRFDDPSTPAAPAEAEESP